MAPASTVTIGPKTEIQQFLSLAREANSLRLAQRLVQVSDAGDAHDKLSPLLHLLGASDSVRTLALWSDTDVRLQPWAALSTHLWHAEELMVQFPPVRDTNRVSIDFRGEMPQRYLSAMSASRLPAGEVRFQVWLRTVKLWLLMRAVDAAEAGYVFEKSIRKACDEVRLACEDDNSRRIPWLAMMVGESSPADSAEFANHILIAASQLRTSGAEISEGQRVLTNALVKAVEGNWEDDTRIRAQPLWQGEFAPWPMQRLIEVSGNGAPPKPADTGEQEEDDEDGDPRGSTGVDPDATPPAQKAKGTSVLLVNQAEGHMLAWDWHSLILDERFLLVDLVESLVQQTRPLSERLGGALMAVALLTSSSARRVPRIKTGRTSATDWKLNLQHGWLHRVAARRDRRWKMDGVDSPKFSKWVRPLTPPWRLQLSTNIAAALRDAMPTRGRSLQTAWDAVSPDVTFEHWINVVLGATPGLARLTSPSLARAQRHCAFESVQDHALARLVSSSSETVLPSPCSYGAYTGATVQAVLGPPFVRLATWVAAASFSDANGAGSEMDVDSVLVRTSIAALHQSIEAAAAASDWARHHNLLTSLCVIALLVCTGARPVNSPFQSLVWFNFDAHLVYVDDKFAGGSHGSRLCILAPTVATLIRDTYVPHLLNLRRALADSVPTVSEAINEVLQGSAAARLPLFFFVRSTPEFDWTEVSEVSLSQECGDNWPLPWNFARHRLATRLRRTGLDAEIIDGLLGHGEVGSESHGAQSLRVLGEDLERARSKVDALTVELDLRAPRTWAIPKVDFARQPTRPLLDESRPYGSAARRERRDLAHGQAATKAIEEIERLLKGRPPETVSGDEWEAIGRQMLLRKDGLPHAFASLRYAAFETYLSRMWHEHGLRPRMRRRHTVPAAARPLVNDLALRARTEVSTLRADFEAVVQRLDGTTIDAQLARALAALDICLHARVSDTSLLVALVQRPNVAVVQYQGQWYIEAFEGSHWSDGMPLRRFAVSSRSCEWLLIGSQMQRQVLKPMPIPEGLKNFTARGPGAQAKTMPDLLKQIGRVVDQFNIITLSGFEAAVMAGRVKLSALPHGDLVRTAEGQAFVQVASAKRASDTLPNEASLVDNWTESGDPGGRTPDACRKLMKDISRVLTSSTERGGKAVEIENLLRQSAFINGDLPHALGRWVVHVLGRGAKTHADVLKLPTVERYFDALASKVTAVGHDAHLVDMDGEELTELYYDLLQAPYFASVARVRKKRGKAAKASPTTLRSQDDAGGDGYAADRLVEFHEFARTLYGLEDPDWSELGEFSDRPSGRPGLLTTAEYLAGLRSLVGARAQRETPAHLVECAWVLLMGFRFGLRGGEAVGLHHEDWIERAGAMVVLVRPNPTRGLKTVRGKRVVPLIEQLTDLERSVIDEITRRFEERPKEVRDRAMLSNLNATNFKYRRLQITGRLLRLVKLVTLNDGAIVHHTRHSFANRIFALLAGHAFGLGSEGKSAAAQCESARRLLLGRMEIDRRALWALCRLMGHSSPVTLMRSYLHLQVTPFAPQTNPIPVSVRARVGFVDLDARARHPDYLKNLPAVDSCEPNTLPQPTLAKIFNYLRLRRIGRPSVTAAYVVGIEPTLGTRIENELTTCALRLEKVHPEERPLQSCQDLIARVSPARFGSLIASTPKITSEDVPAAHREPSACTVGRSRQILLFEAAHFATMASFSRAFRLTERDLVLVQPKALAEGLRQQIEQHHLGRFIASGSQGGPPQQLDKAEIHRPGELSPTNYPHRVAMKIAGDRGCFGSGYELVMAWCCYGLLQLPEAAPRQLI